MRWDGRNLINNPKSSSWMLAEHRGNAKVMVTPEKVACPGMTRGPRAWVRGRAEVGWLETSQTDQDHQELHHSFQQKAGKHHLLNRWSEWLRHGESEEF